MPAGTEDGSFVLGFRQLLSAYSDMIPLVATLFRVGGLVGSWDEFDMETKQVSQVELKEDEGKRFCGVN